VLYISGIDAIENKVISFNFGSIYNFKDNTILPPSLNPSHQGREAVLLPLDGGGRVGVKYNR